MKTTLNKIRDHEPCTSGWKKLLASLGKTKPDDEPLSIITILESNGVDDALWALRAVDGYRREMRLYAVWCARCVEHLLTDDRLRDVINVAERFANGLASIYELRESQCAARAATMAAYWKAASSADLAADWTADCDAARAAGRASYLATSQDAQTAELRRVCLAIESGVDPYPVRQEVGR